MSIMSEAEGISRQMRGDYSHFLSVFLQLKQTQPSIYKWKQVQLLRYLPVEEECCCVSECNHQIFSVAAAASRRINHNELEKPEFPHVFIQVTVS